MKREGSLFPSRSILAGAGFFRQWFRRIVGIVGNLILRQIHLGDVIVIVMVLQFYVEPRKTKEAVREKFMNTVYISHLFPDQEFKEILDETPGLGIETIEFGIGDNLDHGQAALTAYRERLGSYLTGRPVSVHGPFLDLNPGSFDTLIRQATMTRFRQAYACAKDLHAERIIFHSGFNPDTCYEIGWPDKAAEFWQEFLEQCDGTIAVHLENVLDLHWEVVAEILDKADCPFFTACVDVGHVNTYSVQTPAEWLTGLAGKIGHLHLHDNNGKRDEHKALGTGTISPDELFSAICSCCPTSGMTFEHTDGAAVRQSLQVLFHCKPIGFPV